MKDHLYENCQYACSHLAFVSIYIQSFPLGFSQQKTSSRERRILRQLSSGYIVSRSITQIHDDLFALNTSATAYS